MSSLLNAYLTASNVYPDRAKHKELTPALLANANSLLVKVQAFFKDLGLNLENYKISSGFRPSEVNGALANAAKKSLHQQCLAIDIMDDKNQGLAKLVQSRADLRRKHGIWLEDPSYCKGKYTNWVHLDISSVRPHQDDMEFVPK